MPRKKLEDLRDARLQEIIEYAATTVPYYQEFFRANGLSYKDFSTVEDLGLLPIINKSAVMKDPCHFVSTSKAGRESVQFQTSGTTGERVSVWLDRRYLLSQAAVGVREKAVIGEFLGKELKFKTLYINYPECTPAKIWRFYNEAAFTPIGTNRRLISISESFEDIVKAMNEYRPDVLVSYGSYLDLFFRFLEQEKLKCWLPGLVRFGADSLSVVGRNRIESSFGIPVLSNYGTVECFKIGFECGRRPGFHLHEDLCHLRILNSRGEDAIPGEKGEVLISNLTNRGTVLLNYRLGDLAALSCEPCSCGRTSYLLSELEGRVEDVILLEDGRSVHPRSIWSVFKQEPGVQQYQLTQLSHTEFDLKLVTQDVVSFNEVSPMIEERLRSLLGHQVRIVSNYTKEIRREKSGKFRPVRSLCEY